MMHQLEEKQETSLKEQVKRSTRKISYLTTVFFNISPIKQAALLSVLCGVTHDMEVLKKTFNIICVDLNINVLVNAAIEFDELDDSILRIARSDSVETVNYYHPSMEEFLIRQMVGNDARKLKEVVLMNLNDDLLSLSHMIAPGKSIVTGLLERNICLLNGDAPFVAKGISRLLKNSDANLRHLTAAIDWFSISQHTVDLRINDASLFKSLKALLRELMESIFTDSFFNSHKSETCGSWATFSEFSRRRGSWWSLAVVPCF